MEASRYLVQVVPLGESFILISLFNMSRYGVRIQFIDNCMMAAIPSPRSLV